MEPRQIAEAAALSHSCDRQTGVAQEMPGQLDPDAQKVFQRADTEGADKTGREALAGQPGEHSHIGDRPRTLRLSQDARPHAGDEHIRVGVLRRRAGEHDEQILQAMVSGHLPVTLAQPAFAGEAVHHVAPHVKGRTRERASQGTAELARTGCERSVDDHPIGAKRPTSSTMRHRGTLGAYQAGAGHHRLPARGQSEFDRIVKPLNDSRGVAGWAVHMVRPVGMIDSDAFAI